MSSLSAPQNPFRLPLRSRFLAGIAERLLGLDRLAQHYDLAPKNVAAKVFLSNALQQLQVKLTAVDRSGALDSLPQQGPLLIVANHPLGALEGIAIAKLLLEIRPDTKVLTNRLLTRIPELQSSFIGVDVLSSSAKQENAGGLRRATQHLRDGGALLLFPAGQVASFNLRSKKIEDRQWNRLAGSLLRRTGADCLPLYVEGRNSRLFYFLAFIHSRLRTLLLPRELLNKRGSELKLLVGPAISSQELRRLSSDRAVTDYLRFSSALLKTSEQSPSAPCRRNRLEGIAERHSSPDLLSLYLQGLEDCCLLEASQYAVYCVPYARLGPLLKEIAIAREITFRAAGEGTGACLDSDRFDSHYLHLFVWDRRALRIAGGYRMGRVDEIVRQHGIDALYSRSLYEFDHSYLAKVGSALEMGRSFVHPDYQRQPLALDLLWRGIGRYVAEHPQFHTLFGAVSISREHSDLARALIAESMLTSFSAEQEFLDDIRPIEPLRVSSRVWTQEMLSSLNHIAVLNKLIGRCDPGKALPTLLRHYLALNGRFVCFSLNRSFNDTLDGLILVDLRQTPEKYLNRYLGVEGAARFSSRWSAAEDS